MASSPIAASQASDGRWKVWYVPSAGNALSAAILNGGSSKDITYSLTADGFNYGITQDIAEDKRLTLAQNLQRPGRRTETLEIKYVRSSDTGSADTTFVEGLEGKLTIRRGVINSEEAATGQKVDVLTFQAGAKRPDAPTENGVDTITQTLYITSSTVQGGTVVA